MNIENVACYIITGIIFTMLNRLLVIKGPVELGRLISFVLFWPIGIFVLSWCFAEEKAIPWIKKVMSKSY